ncbi:MAG: Autotransporter-associated beta strand repeat protein [Lentisphaerae bacterium ADurb.BinA184]|nr:MAG: Autotransporter-associated beta strand repeat protein [Lentisphaerae bacterium ADurb.BinA184]
MKRLAQTLCLALIVIVAVVGATAVAEIIDPDLDNETYTIDGTSGNGAVSGASVLTGTVTLNQGFFVEYLVVGGGGGGGGGHGGGGGAGGYLEGTSYQVNAQSYPVVVGSFGAGKLDNNGHGASGGNSQFATITAYGGGGGASRNWNSTMPDGGSGGGNAHATRDNGNTLDPAQGNDGGVSGQNDVGGGGGGAGAAGGAATPTVAGAGGAGKTSSITGFATGYAGGGGGGRYTGTSGGSASHGGGAGGYDSTVSAQDGTPNTGGGGGGGGAITGASPYGNGGNGGSGIVVVRYQGTTAATGGTIAESPGSAAGYTVHSFTAVGTSAFNLSGVDFSTRLGATVTASLSGTGSLVYDGPGMLTLAGDNTYTGDTTVNAGTLVLDSAGELMFALSDGGVSNQVRGGGGTVTLDGILRLDDSLLTDTAGTWELIELDTFGVGDLTFGSNFALALVGGAAFADLGGGSYSCLSGKDLWEFSESTGGLTLTHIPEPATLAVFGLAGLGLLRRRPRRA